MSKVVSMIGPDGYYANMDTSEIKARSLNLWQGWNCSVGLNNIYINFDGDVFRGTCRMGGHLGNIFDGVEYPVGWVDCTKRACTCGTEIKIPKIKDEKYRGLLREHNNDLVQVDTIPDDVVAVDYYEADLDVHIQWDIGRRCNFDCSYCLGGEKGTHNNFEPYKPYDVLKRATDELIEHYDGKRLCFCFSGGEPTMHPNFLEWCEYIKSKGDHRIFLTTNGSQGNRYFERLCKVVDVISISVHFEYVKDHLLISNVALVSAMQFEDYDNEIARLEVKFMTTPNDFDRMNALKEKMMGLPTFGAELTMQICPLRVMLGQTELMDYTDKQTKQFGSVTF